MSSRGKKIRRSLKRAQHHRDYIRLIRRPKKADRIDGYVVDRSRRWVVLAAPSEGSPHGFVVLPVSSIRRIEWAPGERFVRHSLKLRKAWPPVAPPKAVDLGGTVADVVDSVARMSPLVTIFTEKRDPGVCYIGRPVRSGRRTLRLKEVDPSGRWETWPERHPLASITRVDFGGVYETNLARVAGPSGHRR